MVARFEVALLGDQLVDLGEKGVHVRQRGGDGTLLFRVVGGIGIVKSVNILGLMRNRCDCLNESACFTNRATNKCSKVTGI